MPKKTTPITSPSTRSPQSTTPMTLKTRLSMGSNASPSPLNTSITLLPRDLTIDPDAAIENIALREEFLEHSTLIEIILKLGYNINKDGICHGYSNLAKNAILAGEFDKFEKRKQFINNNSPGSIIKALRKVKAKLNNNEPLDKNDENYLELMIFFDNIVVSQDPSRAAHLFAGVADLRQGSEASRQLVESVALQKKGGEKELITMPAVFKREELIEFLKAYEKICHDLQLSEPISLQFGAVEHAINVTYMPKTKKWILVDANVFKNPRQNAESAATHHFDDVMQVANKLFNNYLNLVPNHNRPVPYLGMTVKAYATGKNSKAQGFSAALKNTQIYKTVSSPKNRTKAERTDIQNNTFLHVAASLPDYPAASIDYNVHSKNLNVKDHKGNTPLLLAISFGNIKMAEALLEAGADPKIENNRGMSPIFVAESLGQEELVKKLVKRGVKPVLNFDALVAHACENFDKEMLTFLFKVKKADINQGYPFVDKQNPRNPSTHTKYVQPLVYALSHSKFDLAEFLITNGANVAMGIEWAIKENNIPAFNFLLKKIPLDKKTVLKNMFNEAMKDNNPAVISFLAKAIDVNDVYLGQTSPFGDKVNNDRNAAMELIKLEMFTYLDFIQALDSNQEDIIKAMLDHPEHLTKTVLYFLNLPPEKLEMLPTRFRNADLMAFPVLLAVSNGNHDLTERLLKFNFPANTDDPMLKPALHQAVENNDKAMVKLLLRFGTNKKAKSDDQTAYELAISRENHEIAKLIKPIIVQRRPSPMFRSPESPSSASPKRKELDDSGVTRRKKRRDDASSPDPFRNVNVADRKKRR